jgi:hypothetical protein
MFTNPSFLALIVVPSASWNISWAIARALRCPCPGSRSLIRYAFSAKRQSSNRMRSLARPWCVGRVRGTLPGQVQETFREGGSELVQPRDELPSPLVGPVPSARGFLIILEDRLVLLRRHGGLALAYSPGCPRHYPGQQGQGPRLFLVQLRKETLLAEVEAGRPSRHGWRRCASLIC